MTVHCASHTTGSFSVRLSLDPTTEAAPRSAASVCDVKHASGEPSRLAAQLILAPRSYGVARVSRSASDSRCIREPNERSQCRISAKVTGFRGA